MARSAQDMTKRAGAAKPELAHIAAPTKARPAKRGRTTSGGGKPGPKPKFTSEQRELIRQEYTDNEGVTIRQLAKDRDVSVGSMAAVLKGVARKQKKARYIIPEGQVWDLVRQYKRRMGMTAIAESHDVSRSTVWRTIRLRAKFKGQPDVGAGKASRALAPTRKSTELKRQPKEIKGGRVRQVSYERLTAEGVHRETKSGGKVRTVSPAVHTDPEDD